ncbi:FUSC family protein [Streptomyces lydicus]|nr:FUSC family protein [Streptomyces lydicus]
MLVFAGAGELLTGSWWPALVAGAGGALLPFATRHFALQTVAITLMVLSFVYAGGARQAATERIVDTSIACAIVLVVGHLPRLADPRRRVGQRVTSALRATERFLRHVLEAEPERTPPSGGRCAAPPIGRWGGQGGSGDRRRRAARRAGPQPRLADRGLRRRTHRGRRDRLRRTSRPRRPPPEPRGGRAAVPGARRDGRRP